MNTAVDALLTQFPSMKVTATYGDYGTTDTSTDGDVDIVSDLPPLHLSVSVYWLVFYIFVFGTIFLGSIIGNQLVIWSYIIEPKLRRPTNILIVSLAVADFITGLIGLPTAIFGRLFRGPYVCFAATRPFLHIASFMMCSVSVDHLVLITIDRYIAVTRPLKYPTIMTTRKCRIMIAIAWLNASFFGAIPVLTRPPNPTLWVCGRTKYEGSSFRIHRLASVAFIPVILVFLCLVYIRLYIVAMKHVREQSERIKAQTKKDDGSSARSAMIRTTVTTAIVLGAFAICWLPITAKFFVEVFVYTTEEALFTIKTAADVLSLGNSMVNPIIYGYRNALFRSTYKRILRSVCCCGFKDHEKERPNLQTQSNSTSVATISTTV
ncbi:Adenosine receptor A2a [Holothuria leucospilota]|uniref:Adenosine receptor A2a n=1 Tax=Holothuria leucospilota TaxID=206669 RepID=A0A9Q1H2G3_HOLLE|nr:Adenosine receptor A2a [Holothuria leucospilota]